MFIASTPEHYLIAGELNVESVETSYDEEDDDYYYSEGKKDLEDDEYDENTTIRFVLSRVRNLV